MITQMSDRRYYGALALIWFLSSGLLLVASWSNIINWQMGDPDDQMRIVQVRDWLSGQSWWDITQYRMNPPFGGPMHWSRLVDIPIAASILLLTPFLGQPLAEHVTVVAIPLLTYGVAAWLLASTATMIFNRWAGLVAAATLFMIMPATIQLAPMRIDHHGWQLVLFLVAVKALLSRNSPEKAAIAVGLSSAIWIEISVEGIPFTALFLGILALRWLSDQQSTRRQFPLAVAAFAASNALLYLLTEGTRTANHCDSLSPFHVVASVVAALVIVAGHFLSLRLPDKRRLFARIAFGALAGAGALAGVWLLAPQCAGDAFAGLDPLVRKYWYLRTPEGLTLWQHRPSSMLKLLSGIIVTALVMIWAFRRKDIFDLDRKVTLALVFFGSFLVAMQVARTIVYPLVTGILITAPVALRLFALSNVQPGLASRTAIRLLAVVLLVPSLFGTYVANLIAKEATRQRIERNAAEEQFIKLALKCQSKEYIEKLNSLPASQLMAGLDISPGILQFTHHKVIATGHHRNQSAMRDVILGYTGSAEDMRRVLKERDVQYLVSCDGSFELRIYRDMAPNGFWARHKSGESFPWLVRQPDIGVYQIWRIDRGAV